MSLFLGASAAFAQRPDQESLVDRRPFDQITLNDREVIDVMTLKLPQRPLVSVPADGSLTVRLLDRPAEEFEVSWSNVARVRIFEELLLDEARRLAAAGKFDDAYDYFARLLAEYPSLAGLNDAVSEYLRGNALALYQANQHDRALALLLTLYQRNPNYAGLATAVETVAGKIIERYLRDGNYAAARGVLELWRNQFGKFGDAAATEWQRRFEAAATRQLDDAIRLVQEKNYIAARNAVSKATAIWPQLNEAANVVAQIEREFPFISVGVLETSPREPRHRIDCWPAIRTGRLMQRLLAEQVDFGAEGGVYRSPLGKLELAESGRELTLALDPSLATGGHDGSLTADSLARYLLATTKHDHPQYRADLANLLSGVSIAPGAVQLHFDRVYVRPEALLQMPPPVDGQRFSIADYGPEQVVFTTPQAESAAPGGMRAIVEKTLPNDDAAVTAIVSGDIDILDRVPPWQVERLRAAKGIRVESYRLPTVHVLIPNTNRPLLAKREFRRALCFGIDRHWILKSVLLGGMSQPGFEVISGPFPAGTSLSDPIRYGYSNRIAPRPYEPRLAAVLATVALAGVNNPTGRKEDAPAELPELPELTLAHPNDPVARIACQSIQVQLARAGITVKLIEFSADQLLAGAVDCDLRYAELAVWEPLADARTILGPGGLAGDVQSPFMLSALRELDNASNWNDVRARLAEVHDIAHHELLVIPLWQTVNFFAYRESLRGIGEAPVVLYQNVETWSNAAPGNVARIEPARK
ncbi:MAG: ABC transporter substrate-binding protein [Planctomycetes bacterium]|nr:ABC transporter substrate-binding protein [Planctomycetota bacterium]